jgi:hypothetical protein
MLETPEALDKHIQRSSASATISILYDSPTFENEHDKTLSGIHAFIDRMSAASAPGAHLVDVFPWMVYIPERYEPIVWIIALNDGTSDLQSGNVKESNISGNIRRCSVGSWTLFPMIL